MPENASEIKTIKNQHLTFIQVYCGPESSCTVDSDTLAKAFIDVSSKPAILFRIAAKNDKGYGPATQVRWLTNENSSADNNPNNKRSLIR